MLRRTVALAALVFTLTAGAAVAGVAMDLTYTFAPGATSSGRVSAAIDGVEMGRDVPLAVTGEAAVDMTLDVLSIAEDGTATLRVTFGEVQANLLGEAQAPSTPAPMELRVNRRGALVGVQSVDGGQMDLFAHGGVPIELVVLMAGVVELPAEPVAMNESWIVERRQQVPEMGEVQLRTASRVATITETEMTVLTDIRAALPDFTTTNPIQAGETTITNGVLTVNSMKRVVDTRSGLIKSVDATMIFDGGAALGPFPALPLRVVSSFQIKPRVAPTQAGGATNG